MKIVKQLLQVLLLYGIFLVGGWLQNRLHIPLSGSIIGLLLLWVALSLKIIPLKWVESGAYLFLSILPLFFIPATVGVMNFGPFFMGKGIVLIPITIISTIITLWFASLVSQSIAKHLVKSKEGSECN